MAHLSYQDPDGTAHHPLEDAEVVVGRLPSCGVVLHDARVSRRHLRILRRLDGWWVEDLGSRAGTRVNGKRVQEARLADGDQLDLAGEVLCFHDRPVVDSEADTEYIVAERPVADVDLLQTLRSVDRSPAAAPSPLIVLARAGEQLRRCTTIDEVADVALALALETTRAERGVLALLDADGEQVGWFESVAHGEPTAPVQPSRTMVGRMLERAAGVIAQDALADEVLARAESVAAQQIRSLLCAPLWDGEQITGYLYLDAGLAVFRVEDLDLMVVLGHQTAAEIGRLELLERVRDQEERRRQLARFLSPEVIHRVEAESRTGREDALLTAVERVVTVVQVEADGLTELTSSMSIPELTGFVDDLLEGLTRIAVDRHGGTLDQYLGGGVRVLYGAPTTRGEDGDAMAAVTAALEMRDHLEELRSREASWAGIRLRIGLHTGAVVAGMMGAHRRSDYSVIGGVVPVAAQVAGHALVGRVLVTGATHERVEGAFECVPAVDRVVFADGAASVCWWVVRRRGV